MLTKTQKKKRISALRAARNRVVYAENAIARAEKERQFRYEVYKKYEDAVEEAKARLEKEKREVRQLEEKYDRELEAGLWKSKEELLDGIQNECGQDVVASQDEGDQGIPQEGSDRSGGE